MPSYGEVPINEELMKLKTLVEAAKKDNTYAAKADVFDDQIMQVIRKHAATAAQYVKTSNEFSKTLYEEMKLANKQIETLTANKTPQPRDVEVVAALKAKIQKASTDADLDSKALTAVLANGYRGGWPGTARAILRNAAPIDGFVETRKKEIDEGKVYAAYRARLKEWAARAAEFHKQITQASKDGAVEIAEFQKDIEDFLGKMTKSKNDIEVVTGKVRQSMDDIEKISKQKAISAQDKKNSADKSVTVAATMKTIRGKMKTMDIEYEGLKKRAKMAGPGWKEPALKAVKSGTTLHDAATKLVNAANKREADCVKWNEKIQKAK